VTRIDLKRRRALAGTAGVALASVLSRFPSTAQAAEEPVMTRPIPHGGERLPVVGIGTAVIFDFEGDAEKHAARREVIRRLVAGGGRLIDTAHAYGRAEDRLGEIVAELGVRDKLFLATKFSYASDRADATASMRDSLHRLKTDRVDLMQAWNVGDGSYTLDLPREWKQQGLCRYVGVTTSSLRQYDAIGRVVARESPISCR